jgi:hypothetical protein
LAPYRFQIVLALEIAAPLRPTNCTVGNSPIPIANSIRWRLIENRAMLLLNDGLMQTDLWDGDRSAAVARKARGGDFGAKAANQCAAACQSQETSIWVD